MSAIVFILALIFLAMLFPEGTKAFVVFAFKATLVAIAVVAVSLFAFSLLGHKSDNEPQKVSAPKTYHPARIITLSDGTEVPIEASWE